MSQYGLGQYGVIQYGASSYVPDLDAPYLDAQDPFPGETDVTESKIAVLQVLDDWLGVNPDSVQLYLEGALAYDSTNFLAPYNGPGSTRVTVAKGYEYHIQKTSDWGSWELISLRVVAEDLQYPSPNILDETYYFRIRDYLGPLVAPVYPVNHQVNISVSTNVTVNLTDEDLFDDILIEINQGSGWETAYEEGGSPEFKPGWDGPGSVVNVITLGRQIVVDPVLPFPSGTTVQVRVTAFDQWGNPARF